ncbi:MAG: hypothetical protein GF405_09245 [Candidatus Eisenbacteria bacterium]|nr:hypothetical protein [Candidatus Eisenbacteria bacterium]
MIRRSPFVLSLIALLVVAPFASAEVLSDIWFETVLAGSPVGYVHEVTETRPTSIVTGVESRIVVERMGRPVLIDGRERWAETPTGEPLSYRSTARLAVEETTLDATVDDGVIKLRKATGEDATHTSLPFDEDLLWPFAIRQLHAEHAGTEGTTYSFATFDPELEAVVEYDVEVLGSETVTLLGEARSLHKIRLVTPSYPGVEFVEWRDDAGRLWKMEAPELSVAAARTTRESAQASREATDLVASTMIKTNADILEPYAVDEALYELWLEDGAEMAGRIPEDARQTIEGTTDRGILLRVRRVVPDSTRTVTFPVRGAEFEKYLEGNSLMQTWYLRILGAASKSVWETGQDAWLGAVGIEAWVFRIIDNKGFGTALASAREVIERQEGDCSEHAVLTAAMARSVGIPARLVSGIVHADGRFAYHMWVEVWTGDGWYALDATVGRGSVDATHIKFADSAAENGRVGDLAVAIAPFFNRLNVRVVEYTIDGETHTVN